MSDELEPIENVVKRCASGWEPSLYNCTTGSNYLRTSEYYDLIRDLDAFARENAQLKSALAARPEGGAWNAAIDSVVKLLRHNADACTPGSPAETHSWPFVLEQMARKVEKMRQSESPMNLAPSN